MPRCPLANYGATFGAMVGWKTGVCVVAGEGHDGSSALAPMKMSKINTAKSTKHAMYLEQQQDSHDERFLLSRGGGGCMNDRPPIIEVVLSSCGASHPKEARLRSKFVRLFGCCQQLRHR